MLGQVRTVGAAQRPVIIFILFVVFIVAVPLEESLSASDAGDAHDESPPRARTVDGSREDIVLGIMHRED